MILCAYGCNNESKFVIGKLKKPCCSTNFQSCPAMKLKNSKSNIGITKRPYVRTQEHRNKMSKLVSGENNGMFGKKHSEQSKIKMSKNNFGEGNSQFGKIGRITAEKNPMWGKGYLIEGDKNPAWKGGLSRGKRAKYGQGFNKILKEKIRIKYNYECKICQNFGKEVHHIDYDKFNNNENNLVNLCQSCHSKTNFNREYWRKYFE